MSQDAPTVYFIDDSATMREVIKIAFRRENINVVACHDGPSALAQMEQVKPDVVISDVIMPEKDGYQVCEHIKQHPQLGKTPVILMSGVVNRAVAERAFAAKADELIRKPFQPQDLIGRVRHLLNPHSPAASAATLTANAALSSIFASPVANASPISRGAAIPSSAARPAAVQALGRPGAEAPMSMNGSAPSARVAMSIPSSPLPNGQVRHPSAVPPAPSAAGVARPAPALHEVQKLKVEIMRLEGLVRKLQSELDAEREYARALEAHVKTLQEAE